MSVKCILADQVQGEFLPLSGGTMTGAIAMSNNKITGVGTPTANTDAANKTYVDGKIPTKTSQLTNDSGFLTTKPTYTASEVGAYSKAEIDSKISAIDTSLDGKQAKITGTSGDFVVIGSDGNVTTKTMTYAEGVSF